MCPSKSTNRGVVTQPTGCYSSRDDGARACSAFRRRCAERACLGELPLLRQGCNAARASGCLSTTAKHMHMHMHTYKWHEYIYWFQHPCRVSQDLLLFPPLGLVVELAHAGAQECEIEYQCATFLLCIIDESSMLTHILSVPKQVNKQGCGHPTNWLL